MFRERAGDGVEDGYLGLVIAAFVEPVNDDEFWTWNGLRQRRLKVFDKLRLNGIVISKNPLFFWETKCIKLKTYISINCI